MVANRTAAKTARPARKTSAASKKSAPAARKKPTAKSAKSGTSAKPGKSAKPAPAKKAAAAEKTSAKKPAAKKPAVKETAAKTTARKKASPKKTTAPPRKTAPAKKSAPADKAPRETAGGTKSGTKRGTKRGTKSGTGRARTGAKTVVAKNTAESAEPSKASSLPAARAAAEAAGIVEPGELAVRAGEDPWTPQEVAEARSELGVEVRRLRAEISLSERAVSGMMRDSGDGAGDDDADVGTKNISREHEMALANNAREMLTQTEHALERLDNGTYGLCESCGNPIGKARTQAFPRATLCVECKQRSERR